MSKIEKETSKHPITPGDVLPALELLGDMLLEMGRNKEALIDSLPGKFKRTSQ